jgi:hypothetical protein
MLDLRRSQAAAEVPAGEPLDPVPRHPPPPPETGTETGSGSGTGTGTATETDAAPALGKVPDGELAERSCAPAARPAAATYAWPVTVAAFDRRSARSGTGLTSCAHWPAASCSMSPPAAARQHVRVVRTLTGPPAVSQMPADADADVETDAVRCA